MMLHKDERSCAGAVLEGGDQKAQDEDDGAIRDSKRHQHRCVRDRQTAGSAGAAAKELALEPQYPRAVMISSSVGLSDEEPVIWLYQRATARDLFVPLLAQELRSPSDRESSAPILLWQLEDEDHGFREKPISKQ